MAHVALRIEPELTPPASPLTIFPLPFTLSYPGLSVLPKGAMFFLTSGTSYIHLPQSGPLRTFQM